jgi:hypothetical protein
LPVAPFLDEVCAGPDAEKHFPQNGFVKVFSDAVSLCLGQRQIHASALVAPRLARFSQCSVQARMVSFRETVFVK